jgi:glycerophosphoryl diester phosphodiesterase
VGALVAYFAATGPAAGRVLVEAHRGDSSHAPENTIASINSAVGIADLTEWDVQVTSDGAFVLMHDSTVDRTTDGTGPVSSFTLGGIKALDAGSWFSPAFNGEQVPTMAEAIDAALLGGLTPLIERKSGGTAAAYHNEFMNLGLAPAAFRLISFDWNFLDGLDALNSSYNLGALGSGVITQTSINSIKALGADFLDWAHGTVDQAVVDLVHANDMELHVWTVDSPARMQQLIDIGVDGITTNDPATLLQLSIQASRTADLNMDNVADATDWLAYNAGRGVDLMGLSLDEAYQMGDMDGDFDNDITDFVKFKALFQQAQVTGSFESFVATPEPNAGTLFVAGLLLCWGMQRSAPARLIQFKFASTELSESKGTRR